MKNNNKQDNSLFALEQGLIANNTSEQESHQPSPKKRQQKGKRPREEAQAFDFGEAIQLQYDGDAYPTATPAARSFSQSNSFASELEDESLPFEVEAFEVAPDVTPVSKPVTSQPETPIQPVVKQEITPKSVEVQPVQAREKVTSKQMEVQPVQATIVPPSEQPKSARPVKQPTTVEPTPPQEELSDAQEFAADLQAILNGEKTYDAEQKQVVSTSPPPQPKAEAASTPHPHDIFDKGEAAIPPQKQVESEIVPMSRSHAVFDQMGKNMAHATDFDQGTVDLALEQAFDEFDQLLDEEEMELKDHGLQNMPNLAKELSKEEPYNLGKIVAVGISVKNDTGSTKQYGHALQIWVEIDAGENPINPEGATNSIYGVEMEYWEYIHVPEDTYSPIKGEKPETGEKPWSDIYAFNPSSPTFNKSLPKKFHSDYTWEKAVQKAHGKGFKGRKKIGFTDYPGLWQRSGRNTSRTVRFRIVFKDIEKTHEILATQKLEMSNGKLTYSAYVDNKGNYLEAYGFGSENYKQGSKEELEKIAAHGNRLSQNDFEFKPDIPDYALAAVPDFVDKLINNALPDSVRQLISERLKGKGFSEEKKDSSEEKKDSSDVPNTIKDFEDLELDAFLKRPKKPTEKNWSLIRHQFIMKGGVGPGTYLMPDIPNTQRKQYKLDSEGLLVAILQGNTIIKMYYTNNEKRTTSIDKVNKIGLRSFAEIPIEIVNVQAEYAKANIPRMLKNAKTSSQENAHLRSYSVIGGKYIVDVKKQIGQKIMKQTNIEVDHPEVKDISGEWIKAKFNGTEGFIRSSKVKYHNNPKISIQTPKMRLDLSKKDYDYIKERLNKYNWINFDDGNNRIEVGLTFQQLTEMYLGTNRQETEKELFGLYRLRERAKKIEQRDLFGIDEWERQISRSKFLYEAAMAAMRAYNYDSYDKDQIFSGNKVQKSLSSVDLDRLIKLILGKYEYDGFLIGESHFDIASKEFLVKNMRTLTLNKVNTIYVEHIRYREYQQYVDEYMVIDDDTAMPKVLEFFLRGSDQHYNLDKQYPNNLLGLVQKAKENKIRIVGIDEPEAREVKDKNHKPVREGLEEGEERVRRMNYLSWRIIKADEKNRNGGKYVVLVGVKHCHTHPGTELAVPGLSQLLYVPAWKSRRNNDDKDKKRLVEFYKETKKHRIPTSSIKPIDEKQEKD